MARMFFIGLGGAGGITLRHIKRNLSEWLEEHRWTEGIPTAWQFLHIDMPPTVDPVDQSSTDHPPLEVGEYLSLMTASGVTSIDELITRVDAVPGSATVLTGWRIATPPPIDINRSNLVDRATARSVGLLALDGIGTVLRRSIDDLESEHAARQLQRLSALDPRTRDVAEPDRTLTFLIGSLAGTTGSATILDVADLVRALRPDASPPSAWLYTPDVFPLTNSQWHHANALATICELLNSAWWTTIDADWNRSDHRVGAFHDEVAGLATLKAPQLGPIWLAGAPEGDRQAAIPAMAAHLTAIATEAAHQDGFMAQYSASRSADDSADRLDVATDSRQPSTDSVQVLRTLNIASSPYWLNMLHPQHGAAVAGRGLGLVDVVALEGLMRPMSHCLDLGHVDTHTPWATSWWRGKRARPLREFVPLPQDDLRCMIRGWFTGRMLGLINCSQMPYTIVAGVSDGHQTAHFPSVFLSSSSPNTWDRIAHVLESIPLALLATRRTDSLEPLAAYSALRDLGMSDPTGEELLRYERPNPTLDHWMRQGLTGLSDRANPSSVHPQLRAARNAQERSEAVASILEGAISDLDTSFADYMREVEQSREHLGSHILWPGIHDELRYGLMDLRAAVSAAPPRVQ